MGQVGVALTGTARLEKAADAYGLHIRSVPMVKIAERLEVSRKLVKKLIEEETDRVYVAREHTDERQKAIATLEAVTETAWARYSRVKSTSTNVTGLLNTILTARKALNELHGLVSPIQSQATRFGASLLFFS